MTETEALNILNRLREKTWTHTTTKEGIEEARMLNVLRELPEGGTTKELTDLYNQAYEEEIKKVIYRDHDGRMRFEPAEVNILEDERNTILRVVYLDRKGRYKFDWEQETGAVSVTSHDERDLHLAGLLINYELGVSIN